MSDLDEIHDEILEHNAVMDIEIFAKIGSLKAVLFLQADMKLHSRMNSTKTYGILKVKNALVRSVCHFQSSF